MNRGSIRGGRRLGKLCGVLFSVVMALAATVGRCQETDDGGQTRKAERLESLREMTDMIGTLKVWTVSDGDKVEAAPLAKPLLHYHDQPRKIVDATLWCFGKQGRPAAFCKIEKIGAAGRGRWLYCFASLSLSPIEAEWAEGKTFATTGPAVTFSDLVGAPVPAEEKAARLRQVKELVRRINVSLADPDLMFKENLRLLTQPLHLYDDQPAGILDGAIFGFSTNGTCPDLLVLIEAQKAKGARATWRLAVARMTNCELRLRDQDREIWNAPFLRFADRLGENLETWMFFWAKDSR
ncbi:MAG TPA: hypothetical protein VGM05_19295 [Planctomycetaceae bacterium]|jgi:hypothetical protein